MNILVTGGAGFIGAAVSSRLLDRGDSVVCVDNLNDYYEVSLKQARLDRLNHNANHTFIRADISDRRDMENLFGSHHFDVVVNLAAQPGVRHSLENPAAYIDSNLVGFANVLEGCRRGKTGHFVYASSSAVYGGNKKLPCSESDPVDHPISLYAATKKSNELMAHAYSHLYGLPCTGLRFFTVYGPWGRPDMAFFKFSRLILNGESIPVYNNGNLTRDFTYIDDVVEGTVRVIDMPATELMESGPAGLSPETGAAPCRIYNIGSGSRVNLMDYIHALERALGVKARLKMMPMQPGDAQTTHADVTRLSEKFDFSPATSIDLGLDRFVAWYKDYYDAA